MKKRILSLSLALSLALCMALSLCVTAAAAEENYNTFDYRAYANVYPDLKAAYGYDARKLYAHYVNYGKAEGRVGTFISTSNPESGAPIYGNASIPADGSATVPATLLDPLPPTDPSQQPRWSEESLPIQYASNAKVVAEYYSAQSYMAGDQAGSYHTDLVSYWVNYTLPEELADRYQAVAENNPNYYSPHGDVYGRAMQSDTRILFHWYEDISGMSTFATPPADPGMAGNPAQ